MHRLLADAYLWLSSEWDADSGGSAVHQAGACDRAVVANCSAQSQRFAALIALGSVMRDQVRHYEHVAKVCVNRLLAKQTLFGVSIHNRILAGVQLVDSQSCVDGQYSNKGREVAILAPMSSIFLSQLA